MSEQSWDVLLPPMFARAAIPIDGPIHIEPLTGGVSSDIVRVSLSGGRDFCAKRALSKLKVASDWQAPLERNHFEIAWLRKAGEIVPGAAPTVIGEDRAHGIALLQYLPPEDFLLWKAELLAGRADPRVPVAVAEALGRIHAATLNAPEIAAAFATDDFFSALRLDPYLATTARRHPALAEKILGCLRTTASTRIALVHGDVSPKNILISRRDGHPVLLDAECAWYGDPAFDAAFCLNHLLLKSIHLPALAPTLTGQAEAFFAAWLAHFPLALRADLEQRVAILLPCLLLARVDGKSPVEYLTPDGQQAVRDIAMPLIAEPVTATAAIIGRVAVFAQGHR